MEIMRWTTTSSAGTGPALLPSSPLIAVAAGTGWRQWRTAPQPRLPAASPSPPPPRTSARRLPPLRTINNSAAAGADCRAPESLPRLSRLPRDCQAWKSLTSFQRVPELDYKPSKRYHEARTAPIRSASTRTPGNRPHSARRQTHATKLGSRARRRSACAHLSLCRGTNERDLKESVARRLSPRRSAARASRKASAPPPTKIRQSSSIISSTA